MRTRFIAVGGATLALLLAAAVPTLAGGRPLSTGLTGGEEVPPADPDGSGTASLTLNPGQGEVCFTIAVADVATPVAAHIHAAPAGVNGPIVVPLFAGPQGDSSSGCVSADRALVKDIVQHPADYYVNVHTTEFPGGAVRGQLSK